MDAENSKSTSTFSVLGGLLSTILAWVYFLPPSKTGFYPGEPTRKPLPWEYPPPQEYMHELPEAWSSQVGVGLALNCIYTLTEQTTLVHLAHNPVHHWFNKEKQGHMIKYGCLVKLFSSTITGISFCQNYKEISKIWDFVSNQTSSVRGCVVQPSTI